MPVNTRIVRNGQPVDLGGGWSWWHLLQLEDAIRAEGGGDQLAGFWPKSGRYTFKLSHRFTAVEQDVWRDGEWNKPYQFDILPGDVYEAWR